MLKRHHSIHPATRLLRIGLIAGVSALAIACSSDDSDDSNADVDTGDTVGDTVGDNDGTTGDNSEDNAEIPGETRATVIGEVLVFGTDNRTLYTFANDTDGTSNCNGGCATTWPPVAADTAQAEGSFSTIEREDATLQWAFKGSPLYYYQGDASEGEINGEGIGGVWFVARPDPVATAETSIGTVLAASGSVNAGLADATQRQAVDGRTLYVFANDTATTSNCSGGCATNWPPLYADTGARGEGDYTLIDRDDATRQWAYQGQPLYLYAGDSAAGDTTGDGVGGVWSAARP